MADVRLNLFPATVLGPLTNERSVKVYATDTHLWIVGWDAHQQPYVVNHFNVASIDRSNRRANAYLVIDDQGQEWLIARGGGCGCGHPGKRLDVPSWLQAQGLLV